VNGCAYATLKRFWEPTRWQPVVKINTLRWCGPSTGTLPYLPGDVGVFDKKTSIRAGCHVGQDALGKSAKLISSRLQPFIAVRATNGELPVLECLAGVGIKDTIRGPLTSIWGGNESGDHGDN
jgi:hypothetical protein